MGNNVNSSIRLAPSNEEVDNIRNLPYITDKIKNELIELHSRGDNLKEIIMFGIASLSIFLETEMKDARISRINVVQPHKIPNTNNGITDAMVRKILGSHLPELIDDCDVVTRANIITFQVDNGTHYLFGVIYVNDYIDIPVTVLPFLLDGEIKL